MSGRIDSNRPKECMLATESGLLDLIRVRKHAFRLEVNMRNHVAKLKVGKLQQNPLQQLWRRAVRTLVEASDLEA